MRTAVAISTTGDEHRLGFLETCVENWDRVLAPGDSLFVTVDGDEAAVARVAERVHFWTESVFRVGQRALDPRHHPSTWYAPETGQRLGVAVNKNTGLELMMDNARADHLFLCDDDTWPLNKMALAKHVNSDLAHSMVCWGAGRFSHKTTRYAAWTWPRGVLLYATRAVVEAVGGMDERFGPGGHEHAEWSRRIHQAGLTPDAFVTPLVYAERGLTGPNTRAGGTFWHCEDMRKVGEHTNSHRHRRKQITSLRRKGSDWEHINKIMDERDGDTSYVPFRARENGRASATLWSTSTGRGAGGDT